MDASFYRERADLVRSLAGRADPFTERRLLDLAKRYEQQAGKPGDVAPGRTWSLPAKEPARPSGA